MSTSRKEAINFEYDVCLSFAGGNRAYIKQVADGLIEAGLRVFYDEYERAELWGKDLYAHLDDVYQNSAKYCVLFASEDYARKLWTSHERRSAQARAFRENQEYILPARFDDTQIPGLPETVGYIDLRTTSPDELVDLVVKKIGVPERSNYLPPVPDRLLENFEINDEEERKAILVQARGFLDKLKRMNSEERNLIFTIFARCCPDELPDNVHIDLDLLKRLTGFPPSKIKRILGNIRSLGFYCSVKEHNEEDSAYLGKTQIVYLEWHSLSLDHGGNATDVAHAMVMGVVEDFCEEHARERLDRLDFSQLASITASEDVHQEEDKG